MFAIVLEWPIKLQNGFLPPREGEEQRPHSGDEIAHTNEALNQTVGKYEHRHRANSNHQKFAAILKVLKHLSFQPRQKYRTAN